MWHERHCKKARLAEVEPDKVGLADVELAIGGLVTVDNEAEPLGWAEAGTLARARTISTRAEKKLPLAQAYPKRLWLHSRLDARKLLWTIAFILVPIVNDHEARYECAQTYERWANKLSHLNDNKILLDRFPNSANEACNSAAWPNPAISSDICRTKMYEFGGMNLNELT